MNCGCDCSARRWLRGLPLEGKPKCVEEVVPLLVQGIEVRADDGEVFRPFDRTKASRDFLFHFRHSDSAFAEIVGEGNGQVRDEEQNFIGVLAQSA